MTYIAKIKNIGTGEAHNVEWESVYPAALHLYEALVSDGWAGASEPTATKLQTGQPIVHNGLEYVIARKVDVRHRVRMKEEFPDQFPSVTHTTHRDQLIALLTEFRRGYRVAIGEAHTHTQVILDQDDLSAIFTFDPHGSYTGFHIAHYTD